jgi:hypothetical protein
LWERVPLKWRELWHALTMWRPPPKKPPLD